MGMTSFYMGSLRYGPTGKRRKNHFANASKKKPITGFKKHIPEKSQLDILREEQAKQYKSLMEEAMKDGTWITQAGNTAKKENMKYTGTLVKGIATMHKSNAVPIISREEATDIANMRRN